jgi:hypothetical protein
MGEPRLLLEAASSYRGDQEDRLTELLAVALHEHSGFCRAMLAECGVNWESTHVDVSTQQTIRAGPARIDLVIRASDAASDRSAVVFIESKYNPDRRSDAYWFDDRQASRQAVALSAQPEAEQHLVAIASEHDHTRGVPSLYQRPVLGWAAMAELVYRSGGSPGWEIEARGPATPVSQRILLEFWTYLKGDAVGAIDNEDLLALGLIVRAQERIEVLLQGVADALDWETSFGEADSWETPGENPIVYIIGTPDPDSWPASRKGMGALYALVSFGEWNDTGPIGEPQLYAGCGFDAKREERNLLASSDWPAQIEAQGLRFVTDSDGVYVFDRRPMAEIVAGANSLSAQISLATSWVDEAVRRALAVRWPPDAEPQTASRRTPRATRSSRRT